MLLEEHEELQDGLVVLAAKRMPAHIKNQILLGCNTLSWQKVQGILCANALPDWDVWCKKFA